MSNHFALSIEAPPENTPVLSAARTWTLLLLVFVAVHFAALFTPPLLDDADANHANAAQSMARTGDWVTVKVDGVLYRPPGRGFREKGRAFVIWTSPRCHIGWRLPTIASSASTYSPPICLSP